MVPRVEEDLVQGAHLPGEATADPQKAVEVMAVEVNLEREMATVAPHLPEEGTDIRVDRVSWREGGMCRAFWIPRLQAGGVGGGLRKEGGELLPGCV